MVSLEGSLITRLGEGDKVSYYTREYSKTCLECGAILRSTYEIILHPCYQNKENNGDD